MIDRYYTPQTVAEWAVSAVRLPRVRRVLDLAAGDGALLRSASERWPSAEIYGNDSDRSAVRRLREEFPGWSLSAFDALSSQLTRMDRLGKLIGKSDVVLLNPPFSYRGASSMHAMIGDRSLNVSKPMAFLLHALKFVRRGGVLLAIMPKGSLSSDKDRLPWSLLAERYELRVVQALPRSTFVGCYAESVVIRIANVRPRGEVSAVAVRAEWEAANVRVTRGWFQMHRLGRSVGKNRAQLVHTTDFSNGVISNQLPTVRGDRVCSGPGILLPRVGSFEQPKVAVLREGRAVILSDCVFLVHTSTDEEACLGMETITTFWAMLMKHYSGTCAPYITARRLVEAITTIYSLNGFFMESAEARGHMAPAITSPGLDREYAAVPG